MVRVGGEKGRGVPWTSSDRDDRTMDLKFSIPGCFWVAILGKCVLGFFRYSIQYEGSW